jgi:hypothetical protein
MSDELLKDFQEIVENNNINYESSNPTIIERHQQPYYLLNVCNDKQFVANGMKNKLDDLLTKHRYRMEIIK